MLQAQDPKQDPKQKYLHVMKNKTKALTLFHLLVHHLSDWFYLL